jgi:uncharacterized protein YbjT (DUF2867 family)
MNLSVFGATGNVGSRLTAQALKAGHRVTALVRSPGALPAALANAEELSVVQGAIEDHAALLESLRGADVAVVSITGKMSERRFMQDRLPGILEACREAGVARVLLVSVFGAGDTAAKASPLARLVYSTVLRGFLADKAAADRLLIDSGLPFTIAYPVNLKDAAALPTQLTLPLERVASVPGMPTLPLDNAAAALLGLAEDPDLAGRRVLITSETGVRTA